MEMWTFASLSKHRADFLLGRGVWFPARNSRVYIPKQALSFHLSLRSQPWVLMRQEESTGKIESLLPGDSKLSGMTSLQVFHSLIPSDFLR